MVLDMYGKEREEYILFEANDGDGVISTKKIKGGGVNLYELIDQFSYFI